MWNLGQLLRRSRVAMDVDGDSLGNREHPAAEILRVAQAPIRGQRPQEGLLERILCPLGSETPAQSCEHDPTVLGIERLERWDRGHMGI